MIRTIEYYLNNGSLTEDNGFWAFSAGDQSCVATDPRTAISGVVGYGKGSEVFNSLSLRKVTETTGNTSYFDQFERQDTLDPRDLIPVPRPDSSKVVIFDAEGLTALMGDDAVESIVKNQ
jgi:hypothetical protein